MCVCVSVCLCVGGHVHSHTLKKQGRSPFQPPWDMDGHWCNLSPGVYTPKEGGHLAKPELALLQGCQLLTLHAGEGSPCKHRDMQLLATPAELRLVSPVA